MGMEYIGYYLVAIIGLFIIVKIFSWPIKIFLKLVTNTILGAVILFIVNLVGVNFGVTIGINIYTALTVGFLGVPGVFLLLFIKFFM